MEAKSPLPVLLLNDLCTTCPRLTMAAGLYMAEAAAVCLESQNHGSGTSLQVTGEFKIGYTIQWTDVTETMRISYDEEEATEYGACGIAILLMRERTGMTVQRALKGFGFDYWLGSVEEDLPFQNLARLEVSGIRRGDESRITARVKAKREQIQANDEDLPTYIVVVEFSRPLAYVEKQ